MNEHDDINEILGAALEARGLSTEQSSSLIQVIDRLLIESEYYMTREQYEEKTKGLKQIIDQHLEIIEAYRSRERLCSAAGCIDTETTEEVVLEDLEVRVYLCSEHRAHISGV